MTLTPLDRATRAALRLTEAERRTLRARISKSLQTPKGPPKVLRECPRCHRTVGAREMRKPCPHG